MFTLSSCGSFVTLELQQPGESVICVSVTTDGVQHIGQVTIEEFAHMCDEEIKAYMGTLKQKLAFDKKNLKLTCQRSIGITPWECVVKQMRVVLEAAEQTIRMFAMEDLGRFQIEYDIYGNEVSNMRLLCTGEKQSKQLQTEEITTLQDLVHAVSTSYGKNAHVVFVATIYQPKGQWISVSIHGRFDLKQQVLLTNSKLSRPWVKTNFCLTECHGFIRVARHSKDFIKKVHYIPYKCVYNQNNARNN